MAPRRYLGRSFSEPRHSPKDPQVLHTPKSGYISLVRVAKITKGPKIELPHPHKSFYQKRVVAKLHQKFATQYARRSSLQRAKIQQLEGENERLRAWWTIWVEKEAQMGRNIGQEAPREGNQYDEEREWEENLRLLTGAVSRGSVDKAVMQIVDERVKREIARKMNEEKKKAKGWRDRCMRAEDALDALKKEMNLPVTAEEEFWAQVKRQEQEALHLAALEMASGTVNKSKGKQREGEPEKAPEPVAEEEGKEDENLEEEGDEMEDTANKADGEERNEKKRPRTKKAAKGAVDMPTDTVGARVAGRRRCGLP